MRKQTRIFIASILLVISATLVAQTTTDSTTQGLIDAGMDPVIAAQIGGAIRLTLANQTAFVNQLKAASGSSGARVTSTGYQILEQAAFPVGQSSTTGTLALAGCGDSYPKLQFGTAGAGKYFDYNLAVPMEADYLISVKACVGAVGLVPLRMHTEIPSIQTTMASFSLVPATTVASTIPVGIVHLFPGNQILRLVIESTPGAVSYIQWVSATQQ